MFIAAKYRAIISSPGPRDVAAWFVGVVVRGKPLPDCMTLQAYVENGKPVKAARVVFY
jgi:hypothetical protein